MDLVQLSKMKNNAKLRLFILWHKLRRSTIFAFQINI